MTHKTALERLNKLAQKKCLSTSHTIFFEVSATSDYLVKTADNEKDIIIHVPVKDLQWVPEPLENATIENEGPDADIFLTILALSQILIKVLKTNPYILCLHADIPKSFSQKLKENLEEFNHISKTYPVSIHAVIQRTIIVNIIVNIYKDRYVNFFNNVNHIEYLNLKTFIEKAKGRDSEVSKKMLSALETGWNMPKIFPFKNDISLDTQDPDLVTIAVSAIAFTLPIFYSFLETVIPYNLREKLIQH